jgi:hypothetical protein
MYVTVSLEDGAGADVRTSIRLPKGRAYASTGMDRG